MAIENNRNDPYDRDQLREPLRTHIGERPSPAELDDALQVDHEMAEGPASNTWIALLAVGIAIVLGVVFYALNNTSMQQQASTVPTPANSQSSSSPAAAPHANSQPGRTTGSAPANPQSRSPASTGPGGASTNTANPGNANK